MTAEERAQQAEYNKTLAAWRATVPMKKFEQLRQLYRDAGAPLSIGSELSSNEAIKQMTAAGLGVGFLSVHACTLEVRNRLLTALPVTGTPVSADWHVMHKADHAIPTVAAAFHEFIVEHGQQVIHDELERQRRPARRAGAKGARSVA